MGTQLLAPAIVPIVHANGSIESLILPYERLVPMLWFEEIDPAYWTLFFRVRMLLCLSIIKHSLQKHCYFSFVIGVIYVLVIYVLQTFMKHRRPFELCRALVLWNVVLAVYRCKLPLPNATKLLCSGFAAFRLLEETVYQLRTVSFWKTCCYSPDPYSPVGFW